MTTTDPRIIPDEVLDEWNTDATRLHGMTSYQMGADRIVAMRNHIEAEAVQHEKYRTDAIAHMTEMNLRADALTEQVKTLVADLVAERQYNEQLLEQVDTLNREWDGAVFLRNCADARVKMVEQRLADLRGCMGEVADCLQDGGHHFYADRIRALLTEE